MKDRLTAEQREWLDSLIKSPPPVKPLLTAMPADCYFGPGALGAEAPRGMPFSVFHDSTVESIKAVWGTHDKPEPPLRAQVLREAPSKKFPGWNALTNVLGETIAWMMP
jgi:hypothetical protein